MQPHLAIFRAEPQLAALIEPLTSLAGLRITPLDDFEHLIELVEFNQLKPDLLLVPIRLQQGASAVSYCVRLRSHPRLVSIPIVVLATTCDPATIQGLYSAGADLVLPVPFEPQALLLELGKLSHPRVPPGSHHAGAHYGHHAPPEPEPPRQPAILGIPNFGLDLINEAVVLTDPNGRIHFVNRAAAEFLELSTLPADRQGIAGRYPILEQQFVSLIKEHISSTLNDEPDKALRYRLSRFEFRLNRQDGQRLRASTRILSLEEGGRPSGYLISMANLGSLRIVGNSLQQAERTRSLTLILAHCAARLFGSNSLGVPGAPLKRLEQLCAQEQPVGNVANALSALIELVDLISSPGTVVRVHQRMNPPVRMRPSDLFRLIGHLALHTVERAGPEGETSIYVEESESAPEVVITFTSLNKGVPAGEPGNRFLSLLRGEYGDVLAGALLAREGEPYGLGVAIQICTDYQIPFQYRYPSDTESKFRVSIPVIPPSPSKP